MLTIQRVSIERKDYVINWMKLKNNNGMWCFSAEERTYTTHHFLYENSDFPTFYPETFSSPVCNLGAYRFGSPVLWWNFHGGYGTIDLFYFIYLFILFYLFAFFRVKDMVVMSCRGGHLPCALVSIILQCYHSKIWQHS